MKRLLLLAFGLPLLHASVSRADTFNATYLAAGVQASTASNVSVETFDSLASGGGNGFTTTFGNSGITGSYSGSYSIVPANLYGGAGGTGKYITSGGAGSSYTLTLSQNVNYFGLWFSALDGGNDLAFYNGDTLVYRFTPANFSASVGTCPSSSYCGNPNSGQDAGEQFAFINLYDTNGTFNKIVFSELPNTGGQFESDNHTVGTLTLAPSGNPMAVTPEPSSFVLLGTGLAGMTGFVRRRFARAV